MNKLTFSVLLAVIFVGGLFLVFRDKDNSGLLRGSVDQTFCTRVATNTIVQVGPGESRMIVGTSSRQWLKITATTSPAWVMPNFRPTGNGQGIPVFASSTVEINHENLWEGAIYGRAYASTTLSVFDCENAR